jgi:hypothetical protein
MSYGIEHIRYLQGAGRIDQLQAGGTTTQAPLLLRRLWQIDGIGVTEKFAKTPETKPDAQVHLPTLDLLMGLYGFRVPIVFSVQSQEERLSVSMGTFLPHGQISDSGQAARILGERNQIVRALLQATFRSIDARAADPALAEPQAAGIVIGIPSVKPPDAIDGALPLDRIVRAMSGAKWGFLVLAEPVLESMNIELRLKAIEDLKGAKYYLKTLPFPDPLSEHYSELLEATVSDYTYGAGIGGWRTSVFLYGDEADYARLGAVWQGIFSGDRSIHMPIRIARHAELPHMVRDWAYPDVEALKGPGGFRHQYRYQTILSSDQLAAYVHLPHLETNGFSISLVPNFDVMPSPPVTNAKKVTIGKVVSNRRITDTDFTVPLDSLRAHAFVAGVTNSGKTNTLLGILEQTAEAGIPFLVIEPAKAEYRSLLKNKALKKPLRIFTLGNERVAPFRLNPFEPVRGASISVHLDLLRSAFNASFGMWNPLPQVLEQCLHAVYADRGWDLSSDTNVRGDAENSPLAYPTLSDLIRKVDEITPTLGYDEKIASDVRAALRTRLGSLCTGGKGRMLDVRTSIAPQDLFDGFTILELEEMGDDDDKAFVMALVLIRSWEYLKSLGETNQLRHLLVIEEAHRLLTNVAQRSGEEGNPRGKAVESFTNLLSEIRSYGQGVIIVDQVPVRLAPDVIKNTNLKIAHRVVAADDRAALAGAMAMTEQQAMTITTFDTGYAAVYSKGDDAPLLIKAAPIRDKLSRPDDKIVHDEMQLLGSSIQPAHWECAATLSTNHDCETARRIAESAAYQRDLMRLVLSLADENDADVGKFWPMLAAHTSSARRGTANIDVLTKCMIARGAELLADEWGARSSWSYLSVDELASKLRGLLMELSNDESQSLGEFQECLSRLNERSFDPYSHCATVCATKPARCLYRHAAASLAADRSLRTRWADASPLDIADGSRSRTWRIAQDASYLMIHPDGNLASSISAGLCFSQQMLALDPDLVADSRAIAIANIMDAAQATGETNG